MSNRNVLILGANGRFGRVAVSEFAAAGWDVIAQARRPPASLPTRARHLAAALADTDGIIAATAGTEIVVYAVNPLYADWSKQMLPLARQGLNIAERLGALFMLPGNVYGYGENMPALLCESTPEQPSSEKGRLRVQLENELRERAEAGRLRAAVIRAGDFFGCGEGSWLDRVIVKSIASGKLVYPGPLDQAHAWAYLPDLGKAFVAVAELAAQGKAPPFETFNFAGHTLTGAELLNAIQSAATDMGLKPTGAWRHSGMPWGFIRFLGLFMPMMHSIAEMSYLWRVPHLLDGSRLAARVGPLTETPVRQALQQSLIDLRIGTTKPI